MALCGATAAAMLFAAMQAVRTFGIEQEALRPPPPPDVMAYAPRQDAGGQDSAAPHGPDPLALALGQQAPMDGLPGGEDGLTEADPLDLPPPPGARRVLGMRRERGAVGEHWVSLVVPGGEIDRLEAHYRSAAEKRHYRLLDRTTPRESMVNLRFIPDQDRSSGHTGDLLVVHLHAADPQRPRVLVSLSYPVAPATPR